jgi:hypothetical protein
MGTQSEQTRDNNDDDPEEQSVSQQLREKNGSDSATNRPLIIQGLVANLLYFVGAASFVAFATIELNGRDRSSKALGTYTTAFACFLLNGLAEFFIDIFSGRAVRHGRYSLKQFWNLIISIIFVIGTILDIVGFFLWVKKEFVVEHRVLYASSYLWLLTSILVLVGQVPQMANLMDGLDDAGNILFFVGTVVDCVVRAVDDPETAHPDTTVARLEFSSSPMWLASSICYVLADMTRINKISRNTTLPPTTTTTTE